MNNQWLKSFILSADCGSFSKAAKTLFISTTALVQQMNLFEKELGFQVFIRSNSGLKLTSAGEDFYRTATEILKLYDVGKKRAYEKAKGANGIVRIGFEPYQFPDRWITAFNELQIAYPDMQIQLKAVQFPEQIQAVQEESIDACILGKPKKEYLEGVEYMDLFDDTYSFCLQKDSPLAGKSLLTLDDLRDYTIICGDYSFMERSFEEGLEGASKLRHIDQGYDITTRLKFRSKDEVFVIHGSWSDTYYAFYVVIDSQIPAGKVGVVYRKECGEQVKVIRQFLMDNDYI